MATYYVDGDDGADSNAGTSVGSAWATLGQAFSSGGMTTSVANTVHVKPGTYRETVTPTFTNPTAEQKFVADIFWEQAWTSTPTQQEVIWSAFSSDTGDPGSTTLLNISGFDFITCERITFISGDGANGRVIETSSGGATDITFTECVFLDGYPDGSTECMSIDTGSGGTALNWTIQRCIFGPYGRSHMEFTLDDHSSAYDINFDIKHCLFFAAFRSLVFDGVAAGTAYAGCPTVTGCTWVGNSSSEIFRFLDPHTDTTTYPLTVRGCVFYVTDGNAIFEANTSGQIDEDYNILWCRTGHVNTTVGTNTSVNGGTNKSGAPLFDFGQSWLFRRQPMPFMTPMTNCPAIGFTGGQVVADFNEDMFNRPRPGSGSDDDTVGAIEAFNLSTQETTTVRTGSNALLQTGPQVHDFELAVDASSTTVDIYARYDSGTYTGTNYPILRVVNGEQAGVADASDAATTSASDAWEKLTLTFTPTSAGTVTIRIENRSGATAGKCFWDDFAVS